MKDILRRKRRKLSYQRTTTGICREIPLTPSSDLQSPLLIDPFILFVVLLLYLFRSDVRVDKSSLGTTEFSPPPPLSVTAAIRWRASRLTFPMNLDSSPPPKTMSPTFTVTSQTSQVLSLVPSPQFPPNQNPRSPVLDLVYFE